MSHSEHIRIVHAREHNLRNISIDIPRDKFIVVSGVSGSGKSTLAFNTLYAEGQRRYVESLSAYARQFLGKISKPDVESVQGIPPAIAIEQKVNTRNPRSTVGTSTEIYEYLKLLYARIGVTYSPVSNQVVQKHTVKDAIDLIVNLPDGTKGIILAPLINRNELSPANFLRMLLQQGYSRLEADGTPELIEDLLKTPPENLFGKGCLLIIDRFETNTDSALADRLADSLENAFFEGEGNCFIRILDRGKTRLHHFSNKFEADGITFDLPTPHLFSFNSPAGACPVCEGFGQTIGIDPDLVIPNKNLSVYEDCIAPWKGEVMGEWKNDLVMNSHHFDFPIHKPYYELSQEQRQLLWTGNRHFHGLNSFFAHLEENLYKIQYRVMLARYRGKTICPECRGSRLKKEAGYVKINGVSLPDLMLLPVNELSHWFSQPELTETELKVAGRLLQEIRSRLSFLTNVGLGYLSLNRPSNTLSGGESQRINLATSLGSSLVGSLYILDEPSIGLHPSDTMRLISVLKKLQKTGNTVLLVEHDEDIIRSADFIIDMGPGAGSNGGEIVFAGNQDEFSLSKNSLTADYLNLRKKIPVPAKRRTWTDRIEIIGARENNLKNIDVKIPLRVFTVITGVSGSGKSTLVKKILYPALKKQMGGYGEKTGAFDMLKGDLRQLGEVEIVDQNPVGKSTRSNPVTYIKAYDEIRSLYANHQLSKQNGFKPSHFSFNVEGGRCDECLGEGVIHVEMQFMADVTLVCESCGGKRFKPEVLEVEYHGRSISDLLDMTVDDAISFFQDHKGSAEKKIVQKLEILQKVGLGYVKLGQSSSTLSGGESQRLKLASFLSREAPSPTLYIFDEPTTGLHPDDILKLLNSFYDLIRQGHTVVVIEHHPDVIKCADWIIDMGPEGGEKGGYVVFEGKPEDLVEEPENKTGYYLKGKLS